MTAGDPTGIVGLIANPMAGKDIRRLVSAASPVSDMAKVGIIRRAMIGAFEGGATKIVVSDDRSALARRAAEEVDGDVQALDIAMMSNSRDSQRAAATMADAGVSTVIVLGGDGTHRDVAKGWRDAAMVTLSTGTNNVFPRPVESTLAGHAAGLVASGRVALVDCARRAKAIDVVLDDGTRDLALVDVALTDDSFTASRAVWRVETIKDLVAVIAEPASVGLSAIAAAVEPLARTSPGGVHVRIRTGGKIVRVPIAPGRYESLSVQRHERLATGDAVRLRGPGVLSFDGERDVVLESSGAVLTIAADGPWVIDVASALAAGQAISDVVPGESDRGDG